MERVGILINKLQEQLGQEAAAEKMLVTAQMLCAELLLKAGQETNSVTSKISVILPNNVPAYTAQPATPLKENSEPKQIVPEKTSFNISKTDVPLEKEPVAAPAQPVEQQHEKSHPSDKSFDHTEPPMPAHPQKAKITGELNETISVAGSSINDKLKEEKPEVAHFLSDVPIRDLKKAITINDRHLFIDHLFRGDETMYERSIKTINSFSIFAEAEFWIQRELKVKLGWDTNHPEVKLFDQLVKRRFLTT